MSVLSAVKIRTVYEVHCLLCGQAVLNDATGDAQYGVRELADLARLEHVAEHGQEAP